MSLGLAPAGVAGGAAAAGYAIGSGSWMPVVLLAVLVLVPSIIPYARRLLLAATVISLVLGSSIYPQLKVPIFYFRFFLIFALLAATLKFPVVSSVRHSAGMVKCSFALVGLAVTSVVWSVNPSVTLQRGISLLLLLVVVLESARRVWVSVAEVARDLAFVATAVGVTFVIGLVSAAAGMESALAGGRFRGILENPNGVGVVGALMLPISLGFVGDRQGRRRLWWAGVAVATAMSLVFSQSRGGILAAGLGVVVLVGLSRGVRRPLVVVASCVVGTALLTGLGSTETRLPGPIEAVVVRFDQDSTAGGRTAAWQLALRLARERPATGWGFGTSEEVFGPEVHTIGSVFQGALVHNSYLQILLELGPAGVFLLLLVLSGALIFGWPSAGADPLRAAIYGALIAGSVSAVVESTLLSVGSIFGFTFWFLAAASVHLRWLASADSSAESPIAFTQAEGNPLLTRRAWQSAPVGGIGWRRT